MPGQHTNDRLSRPSNGISNWDASKLRQAAASLEKARVLVKNGSKTYLIPDLLKLVILQQACRADFDAFGFRDAYGVSFRLRETFYLTATADRMAGQKYSVLDPVWRELELRLRRSTSFERVMLLDEIGDLGYILPEKTLELVEFLMYNPAPEDPEQPLRQLHEFKQKDVLRKLPSMLAQLLIRRRVWCSDAFSCFGG